ncbi:hypothetical protein B0H10DRAFT_2122320 [Mycena sp. CBHHK59/15]|nr:hypothetical protein B0H10DRAFT_2122320 [Mycena sp. CBHHK59/15]
MGNINASPRPATRSLCVKLIASAGTRFKFDVSLPDDETRARAIEGAIFRATRGDLRLYQGTFRRIYLHLRNKTRLNVTVIGLRGAQTFNLLRRHTIKKLRLAVRQRLGGAEAHFFWRPTTWQLLQDSDTPNSLHMRAQERVYYVPHMVVVQSGSCKYRFGVAPTYALNSLCGFFPMEPSFQLQYQARPIDTADTPETLGAPREREFLLSASYRNRATSDPDALLSEPLTPSEERTPPPGSVQVTPQYETRLRERKA